MDTGKIKFFDVLCNSAEGIKARTGIIKTAHSEIPTPVFMPVGTLGTVKAVENRELVELGAQIILGNTYHLYLRPGMEVLDSIGGLHKFMSWNRSLLTDSGGFQVFSLSALKKVSEDGVEFASHLDGSRHFFTPEKIIDIQRTIGSDIIMPLDECLPNPSDFSKVEKSIKLTVDWEKRCYSRFHTEGTDIKSKQSLFAICQGGTYKDLRKRCIEDLLDLDFDGYAIGGLAVGEENSVMYDITDYSTALLPEDKPRYLMGVGTPLDLLECVEKGVDMFDCVMPTRNARHGRLFTTYGEINVKNAKYAKDENSPDEECETYTSKNFSLAYIRHLIMNKEITGAQLASVHNVGFYLKLMENIRKAIQENRFKDFKKSFIEKYTSNK